MKKLCKLVMLPTDYADNAILVFNGQYKFAEYHENQYFTQQYLKSIGTGGTTSHHLYVLVDDEIKLNDYVQTYHSRSTLPVIHHCVTEGDVISAKALGCLKVIATTDKHLLALKFRRTKLEAMSNVLSGVRNKISSDFINLYVSEYNKGNIISEVLVEYEGAFDTSIKVKSDGDKSLFITLSKTTWTREEVVNLCLAAIQHGKKIQAFHQSGMNAKYAPISENQWLIDNL